MSLISCSVFMTAIGWGPFATGSMMKAVFWMIAKVLLLLLLCNCEHWSGPAVPWKRTRAIPPPKGEGGDWLRMLIAPGGSLGGARPKASVVDDDGHLWIAKFPSIRDDHDVGGWEMVVNALGDSCGLRMASGMAHRFASDHHCFMVKRFDRTDTGGRLHFASAMTLTDRVDGDDGAVGASYLELAEVLIREGAQTNADLRELWSRIVFNILVSNTDDHLRNHGFILEPGRGWRLSPAYDLNPVPYADGLKLNITDADNALDLELAREVAGYFRVRRDDAEGIISDFQDVVRQWMRWVCRNESRTIWRRHSDWRPIRRPHKRHHPEAGAFFVPVHPYNRAARGTPLRMPGPFLRSAHLMSFKNSENAPASAVSPA